MSECNVGDVTMDNFFGPSNSLLGGPKDGYLDETLYGLEEQYKPASRKKFNISVFLGILLFILIASGLFYLIVYMPNDKYNLVKKNAIFDSSSPIHMYQEHRNYQNYIFRPENVSMDILKPLPTLNYRPITVTHTIFDEITSSPFITKTKKYIFSTKSTRIPLIVNKIKETHIFRVNISTYNVTRKMLPESTNPTSTERLKLKIEPTTSGKRMFNFSSYIQDAYGSTINSYERLNNVAYDVHKNSCDEIKKAGPSSNGVYTLFINKKKVPAICDMKADSGPYMVVQRRISSDVVFWDKTFEDYKLGFGNPTTNYWFGLEHLYQYQEYLRKNSENKDYVLLLRIELRTNPCGSESSSCSQTNVPIPTYFWHEYKMKLGGLDDYYRLNIESIRGNLSTQNDYFVYINNGRKFTTVDVDNDDSSKTNCAQRYYSGGWWYHQCSHTNLNGIYPDPKNSTTKNGMKWRYSSPNKLNSASSVGVKWDVHPDATLMLVKPL
uniref:Fibrinogen C-terminal domain-containing protein n=1 Tax=Strongyloides venezuelensis TaxID=75913 RepID=A0A0K0FDP2_STRVS